MPPVGWTAAGPRASRGGRPWGRLSRPGRVQRRGGEPASLAKHLPEALAFYGWTVDRRRAFGGMSGGGFAAASRFTARLGRPDLADRAEHAYRRASETGPRPE